MELFLELLIIILSTKLAGDLAVKLGQPSVLGKLIIGVIIGPAVLGWVQNSKVIESFSHIGVLLLMFIAGLETNIRDLNQNRRSSIAVAVGGVIIPFFGGYVSGIAIGMTNSHALFLGLLLSATSVSISVQTFKELEQLKSKESITVLGAALFDDILAVIILAVMMSLLTGEQISLSMVIGKILLSFVLMIILGWKITPWLMSRLAPLKVTESIISAGIVICLLFAYIAEYLGIAGIIGAFAAGIAISQTQYKKEVETKLEPIAYAVFVPVFFASIGFSVRFEGLSNQLGVVLVLTIISIFTKLVGGGLGAKLTGFNVRSSMVIGVSMISRGEVALILGAIGLETNLLNSTYFTALIIVIIITTLVTPPLLKVLFKELRSLD